jgi:hypothetical protein
MTRHYLHAIFFRSEEVSAVYMSKLINFQTLTQTRYNMSLYFDDILLQLTIPCMPSSLNRARNEMLAAMDQYDLHEDWPKVFMLINEEPHDVPNRYIDGRM